MEYNFSMLWAKQFFGFYQFKSFYEYASDEELLKSVALALKNINISVIDKGELLADSNWATENQ